MEREATNLDPATPPSVVIDRRQLLWLPLAAASWLVGRGTSLSASAGLTWPEFLEQCVPVAEAMRKLPVLDEDAYLYRIASFAAGLRGAPETALAPFGGLEPRVEFGVSFRGTPFIAVQWRMEPGAILPAHCHPRASVCTVGLEGQARLRNFEVGGEAPAYDSGAATSFLIRETRSEILGPGRVSTLSSTRDNIHYFEASREGARGVDFTTVLGGDGSFSFIDFEPEKPADRERGLFEAVWTGQKPPRPRGR